MKQQIKLSEIAGVENFAVAVAAHALEMKNWNAHMARVLDDQKKPPANPMDCHWPLKRPHAHPAVEKALDENGEANFEFVDDTPRPEKLSLAQRKMNLIHQVTNAQEAAQLLAVPFGKRDLFSFREQAIVAADGALRTSLYVNNNKILKKITGATLSAEDVESKVTAARSPEDSDHLKKQEARRQEFARINMIAAQAKHDIEDLTEETIDGWKLPVF